MSSVTLSEGAEEHILRIQTYTIENFGERQAVRYLESLDKCLRLLATQSRMGRLAPKLGAAVRRHEHESHVILYEIVESGIVVLGVVHERNIKDLEV